MLIKVKFTNELGKMICWFFFSLHLSFFRSVLMLGQQFRTSSMFFGDFSNWTTIWPCSVSGIQYLIYLFWGEKKKYFRVSIISTYLCILLENTREKVTTTSCWTKFMSPNIVHGQKSNSHSICMFLVRTISKFLFSFSSELFVRSFRPAN